MKIISARPCLRLRTNFGPGLHFGAWFGFNFGPCLGFHFGRRLGPLILFVIVGPKTVSHAWENQQHACYYGGTPMRHHKTACFEALVLEPHFAQSCGRFLLLYCILGWQSSLQASFHWKMQNVNCQLVQHLRAAYVQTVEQFAQRASETGNKVRYVGILRIVAKMLASTVPLLRNVDL